MSLDSPGVGEHKIMVGNSFPPATIIITKQQPIRHLIYEKINLEVYNITSSSIIIMPMLFKTHGYSIEVN